MPWLHTAMALSQQWGHMLLCKDALLAAKLHWPTRHVCGTLIPVQFKNTCRACRQVGRQQCLDRLPTRARTTRPTPRHNRHAATAAAARAGVKGGGVLATAWAMHTAAPTARAAAATPNASTRGRRLSRSRILLHPAIASTHRPSSNIGCRLRSLEATTLRPHRQPATAAPWLLLLMRPSGLRLPRFSC